MNKLFFGFVLILSLNLSYAAEEEFYPSMVQMQTDAFESETEVDSFSAFTLHNIAILTRIEAEVEIPWIAKLNLKPEIELHWSR